MHLTNKKSSVVLHTCKKLNSIFTNIKRFQKTLHILQKILREILALQIVEIKKTK